MASRMLDQAKAKAWMIEVNDEIESINQLLSKVDEELETNPHDDDTIMNMLHQIGIGFSGAWKELIIGFQKTSEKTGDMIAIMSTGVSNTIENLANFVQGKGY